MPAAMRRPDPGPVKASEPEDAVTMLPPPPCVAGACVELDPDAVVEVAWGLDVVVVEPPGAVVEVDVVEPGSVVVVVVDVVVDEVVAVVVVVVVDPASAAVAAIVGVTGATPLGAVGTMPPWDESLA